MSMMAKLDRSQRLSGWDEDGNWYKGPPPFDKKAPPLELGLGHAI